MNNTTFGDEGCGYYETICGGAGAVSLNMRRAPMASSWMPVNKQANR